MEIIEVPIDKIIIEEVEPDKSLVKTIKDHGLLQNVILTKENEKYRIVAGRRRIQSSIKAGKNNVYAIVIENDPIKIATISLIENLARGPNPALEAENLKKLLDTGMTQQSIANMLGLSQSQISKRIKLLNLTPNLFNRLKKGELRVSTSRELAKLPMNKQKKYEKEEKILLEDVEKETRKEMIENLKFSPAEYSTVISPYDYECFCGFKTSSRTEVIDHFFEKHIKTIKKGVEEDENRK